MDTYFSSELSVPGCAFRASPLLTAYISWDGEEAFLLPLGVAQNWILSD